MANLHRCLICDWPKGHDFESDEPKPKCPKCKRGGSAIADRVDVHFLHPDESGPITGKHELQYRVACQPDKPFLGGMPASDFLGAVTCKKCRQSPKFRDYEVQSVAAASLTIDSPCA